MPDIPEGIPWEGGKPTMHEELSAIQADITKCLKRLKKIMDKLEIGD
jgi:hypothetical protein